MHAVDCITKVERQTYPDELRISKFRTDKHHSIIQVRQRLWYTCLKSVTKQFDQRLSDYIILGQEV